MNTDKCEWVELIDAPPELYDAPPELYEALEYAMPVLELALIKGHPGAESAVKVARAALAKARGETQ